MSTPKKQKQANLQKLFHQIEGKFFSHPRSPPARCANRELHRTPLLSAELLIKIKPKLKDITSSSVDAGTVVKDLHQIASLAQSFSDQRFKSGNNDGHFTDALDQQGL